MTTPSVETQREWARIGAAHRLDELQKEEAAILAVFPELRRGRAGVRHVKPTKTRRKKKRTISAEGRKRMAAGMRKYWAAKKKEAAKK